MELLPQAPDKSDDNADLVAHRLPCTIHTSGELQTARVFCPFPKPLQTFRGRKLEHAMFELPQTSQLVVIERNGDTNAGRERPSSVGQQHADSYVVKHVVHSKGFHYEHDITPSDDSPMSQTLRWLSLSAALHSPTIPEPEPEQCPTSSGKVVDGDDNNTKTQL